MRLAGSSGSGGVRESRLEARPKGRPPDPEVDSRARGVVLVEKGHGSRRVSEDPSRTSPPPSVYELARSRWTAVRIGCLHPSAPGLPPWSLLLRRLSRRVLHAAVFPFTCIRLAKVCPLKWASGKREYRGRRISRTAARLDQSDPRVPAEHPLARVRVGDLPLDRAVLAGLFPKEEDVSRNRRYPDDEDHRVDRGEHSAHGG